MGIEPTYSAWKAEVLPLNYTRLNLDPPPNSGSMVEGGGFEPPKAEPSDLQSDPFGHSGTPPKSKQRILFERGPPVKTNAVVKRGYSNEVSGGTFAVASQSRRCRNSEPSWASGVPGSGCQS